MMIWLGKTCRRAYSLLIGCYADKVQHDGAAVNKAALSSDHHIHQGKRAMSVDKDTVKKIARLARIHVSDDRLEPLAGELNHILRWVETLDEVDTSDVEPLASVTGHSLPLRTDEVSDGNISDKVLGNAPDAASGFFVVPKVVE